ncbi:MAG: phytochelatin synthase family protein [Rhodoferax sp.]|nr:phytochelatin synthase family protein [Rhodoferax sp.]
MLYLARFVLATLIGTTLIPWAGATGAAPEVVATPALVSFASQEGLTRLARSTAKTDFAALANQFEPQSNGAFCGPTTTAIVLNAINVESSVLPRDHSRLRPADLAFLPKSVDLSLPRFTQDNVILAGSKTRAQVFGEPTLINGKQVMDVGYQLRQLDQMLRANGLMTELKVVDDIKPMEEIRADLKSALEQSGRYVVVNYKRSAIGQKGGGHISPLGAYDAASDSVLILDVNPTAAGWVWIPVATLAAGMRTFDTVENRGYILVRAP